MIPLLTTTTVTIKRPATGDPYETAASETTVASGVRAHISSPTGSEQAVGGQLEQADAVLLCESGHGIAHTDLVDDDETGERWRVVWVRDRQGLGLDHTKAGLVAFRGGAVGA